MFMSGFGEDDGDGKEGAGDVQLGAVALVSGCQTQSPNFLTEICDQTALTWVRKFTVK